MRATIEEKQLVWNELLAWQQTTNTVMVPYHEMERVKDLIFEDAYLWDRISKFIGYNMPITFIRTSHEKAYYWLMGFMSAQVEIKYQASV